jgi:tetratricopeptide (TPR) repeat protein
MQAVHGTFLPGSRHWHLAEVLLSGLLRRPPATGNGPSLVEYEFKPGLRRSLLATLTRDETAHVQRVVEDVLGAEEPAVSGLRQVLAAPDDAALPNITSRNAALIAVQSEVFAALSGPYAHWASRLNAGLSAYARYHQEAGATEVGPARSRDVGALSTSAVTHATGSSTRRASSVVPTGSEPSSEARSPEKQPRIWGGVPLRNVNFIGRSDLLERLFDEISRSTATALLPGALHGMGGIGKSQVAVEYVYRHADDYDLVWWIPAENLSEIQASLVKLAQRLELPAEYSVDTAVPAVLEALHSETFPHRWLLVYDNADEPEEVRAFWPRGGNGHIIVTSRNPQWAEVARSVPVEVFLRTESCELLQRRNPDLSDEDADRLATVLGDLPLAVEQAAAWRAETGMSTEEYLRLFEDKRTELLATRAPADYDVSVEAAWNVSLDRIREFNPGALELLEICAFLSPEPISRTIFSGVRNIPVPPDLERILADPIELSRAVREINRYSLARIDHRNDTLQLHRLVQLVLRNKLAPDQQERVQHIAHLLLANRDPRSPYSTEHWPVYADLLPHVRVVEAHTCSDPWVRRLVINTIIYQYAFGNPSGGLVMAKDCAAFWSEKLGEKHQDTLIASRWWGRLLRALGRFEEGRVVAERTLAFMQETMGETHEETLLTMHGVASDLRAKGDFRAAREMNEFAYRAAVDRFGPDDPDTLAAANNYALALRLDGDVKAALQLDEQVLEGKKIVLGEDHRHTLLTMDNWTVDLREAGQYLRARDEQNEVVHRMRTQLGDRHPMTLAAIKNLATAHRRAGDHEKVSLALAFEARDGLVSRYGESHPEAMSAVLDLSVGHRQDGNLAEARRLGEHAKLLYERNWGVRHPFSLAAATNLAVTLRLLGAADLARNLNARALENMREAVGADHPFTLICATNHASDLAECGDHEAAYALDQDTYSRSVRVLGEDHPSTLALQVNLALDLRHLNRTEEADTTQTDAITRLRRVLGTTHPATMAAQFNHRANCDIDTLQI